MCEGITFIVTYGKLVLVKKRYEPRFFFCAPATDLTSLLTSARTLGAIVPDRGPLESRTPLAGRK